MRKGRIPAAEDTVFIACVHAQAVERDPSAERAAMTSDVIRAVPLCAVTVERFGACVPF